MRVVQTWLSAKSHPVHTTTQQGLTCHNVQHAVGHVPITFAMLSLNQSFHTSASVDIGPSCCSAAVTPLRSGSQQYDNLALIGIQTPMNAVCIHDPTQIAWPASSV